MLRNDGLLPSVFPYTKHPTPHLSYFCFLCLRTFWASFTLPEQLLYKHSSSTAPSSSFLSSHISFSFPPTSLHSLLVCRHLHLSLTATSHSPCALATLLFVSSVLSAPSAASPTPHPAPLSSALLSAPHRHSAAMRSDAYSHTPAITSHYSHRFCLPRPHYSTSTCPAAPSRTSHSPRAGSFSHRPSRFLLAPHVPY